MGVLITGAGSGVGRGLALSLASAGHRIVVTDQSLDRAMETVRLVCEAAAGAARVSAHELDVTDPASISALQAELGGVAIDVLINNAGLQHVSRIEDFPPERWELLIDVMLTGAMRMSRAVLPGMRKAGFGRIINIGSIHSVVASSFKSAYVAAKHGLVGLSKVLALESADTDITVNTICPSYVRTPLVDAQIDAQARTHGISPQDVIDQIMLKPMPKRCFVTVEEIAGTVAFLMSPAARNITGQCIVIDGGWTIQ